ncbi:helix-turn-helix domain-containing protein [Candidatus Avoscillospira sp. LCP25S3_F1]|uniref:helix-turn-helix domain-containing protein n=1 Tax=Candidatus Avoscillospira sp. LCP25S3_F1 TaxID=3438825 RepID=UPI003F8DC58C
METNGKRSKLFWKQKGLILNHLSEFGWLFTSNNRSRMYHYEFAKGSPQPAVLEKISDVLDVSTEILKVPDMKNIISIMHILFAVENEPKAKICNDVGCVTLPRIIGGC